MTSRLSPPAATLSDPLAPSDTEEDFASASEGGESDSEDNQPSLEPTTAAPASPSLPPAAPPSKPTTQPEKEAKPQEENPLTQTDPPKRTAADALSRIVSEEKQDAAVGGWGGWGSWLSSTVKSVTSEFENPNLDSLLNKASSIGSNIRTVAARTVDNVYENLDPEYEREMQNARQTDGRETETGGASPTNQDTDKTPKDGEAEQAELDVAAEMKKTASHAAENILQTIDKTFDFASNALGTAVLGGYRKLEQVKIKERLEHLQQDVTSSEVMHVGENVVSSGLGALEALGRKAIDILNEERSPISPEARGSAPAKSKGESAKATLNGFFEDNCGNAHIQALSMLSAECSLRMTSISSLAAGSPTATTTLKELEKIFDTDEMLEEVEEIDESICASEAGMREMNLLVDRMGLKASSQLRQLQAIMRNLENVVEVETEQFQKDLAAAITAASSTSAEDKMKLYVKDILNSSLLKTYTNGIRSLANFAEKSCEQILRISEAFLMRIAEDKLMYNASEANHADPKPEAAKDIITAKEYGTSLRKLTVQLLTETQYVSTLYIRCLAKLVETAKNKSGDELLVPLEKDQAERMAGKLTELNDQLYTDAGQAMTFVQDAMHSNLTILKLMLLQQLANERDKKTPVSEKE